LRYAVITRHRGEFQVRLMCRVLEVAPSGYYASLTRPSSWHALIDDVLMAHVRIAHAASGDTYGAPRVQRELQAAGLPVSPKRVARLMREGGLVARQRKARRIATTDSNHAEPIAPNLLARQFDVQGVAINRVWVADMTYIPTREGWLYLATVLDLGSRRCVGWAMHDTLETDLPLRALRMACGARQPARGLLHHSDRGSQPGARVPRRTHGPRHGGEYERQGRLLRQRRGGEFLRDARVRTHHAARLGDEGRGAARDLSLHRDVV
jgi:putative transposase